MPPPPAKTKVVEPVLQIRSPQLQESPPDGKASKERFEGVKPPKIQLFAPEEDTIKLVGNPVGNFIENTIEIGKGLFDFAINAPISPIGFAQSSIRGIGAGDYTAPFREAKDFIFSMPGAVVEGFKETYKGGLLTALWNKTGYVFVDFIGFASLGAGFTGRVGAGATRLADAARLAGNAEKAARLQGIANRFIGIESRFRAAPKFLLKPVTVAGKQVLKIPPFKKAAEISQAVKDNLQTRFGMGQKGFESVTDKLLTILAEEERRVPWAWQRDVNKLLITLVPDPEQRRGATLALLTGNPGFVDDILAKGGEPARVFKAFREIQNESHEMSLLERMILSNEEALGSTAKQVALLDPEVVARFKGKITPESVQFAKKLILERAAKNPLHAPSYLTFFALSGEGSPLLRQLGINQDAYFKTASKRVSRFERRAGTGVYETDLAKIAPRMFLNFHKVNARIRAFDRMIGALQKAGQLKVLRATDELAEGWVAIPDAIWKRYWDYYGRGQAALIRETIPELARKLGPEGSAEKVFAELVGKRAELAEARLIAVPTYVGNLLTQYFAPPGPYWRMFDRLKDAWAFTVTRLNPRYYLGNAVGDAIISAFFGVNPKLAWEARAVRDVLPYRMRSRKAPEVPGPGWKERTAANAAELLDAINNVDNSIFRIPAVATQIKKELRQEFAKARQAGITFEALSGEIKTLDQTGFFREVFNAPNVTADLQSARQVLLERVARGIIEPPKLDRAAKKGIALADKIRERLKGVPPQAKGRAALLKRLDRVESAVGFLERRRDELLQSRYDEFLRARRIESVLPQYEKYADVMNEAIRKANQWVGEYDVMLPVVKTWFRRGIPFWVFASTMAKLAFRLPFIRPKTTFLFSKFAEALNSAMDDPELPHWMRGYTPLFVAEDGKFVLGRFLGLSPMESARIGTWEGNVAVPLPFKSELERLTGIPKLGEIPLLSIFNPLSQNPLIKAGFNAAGGFTRDTLKSGEYLVDIGRGEAWQYIGDGRLEKRIPQSNLTRELFQSFPITQFLDQLIHGHVQTSRGWLLWDDPLTDRHGDPMYPIEAWQSVVSFFGPKMITVDLEQQKRINRLRLRRVIKLADEAVRKRLIDRDTALQMKRDYVQNILRFEVAGER